MLSFRWDSSDPDRAPPPLPMNPSSPIVATSRPNTSSAIQSAHAALTEKARESGYISNAVTKRIEASPERSLIKGAAHKRMKSLQVGTVRDMSSFIEGGSSFGSPKSPEKSKDFMLEGRSPIGKKESGRVRLYAGRGIDCKRKIPTAQQLQHQPVRAPSRETPQLRPSLRRPPRTSGRKHTTPICYNACSSKYGQPRCGSSSLKCYKWIYRAGSFLTSFDAISNQILSLTSIATICREKWPNSVGGVRTMQRISSA